MKKLLLIILASFIFLLGASITYLSLELISFTKALIPLLIGASLIVLSIIALIVFLIKETNVILYVIFFINMISMGFLIKSWHIFRGYNFELYTFILISLLCIAYLIIFYVLSFIPIFSKHYGIFLIVFLILSIIAYIALIICTKTDFLSTYGYYMIIEIGFLLAMSVYTNNNKEIIKAISFSTFLVIIVCIIIAIIMLDGEPEFDLYGANFDLMSPKEQLELKSKTVNTK